MEIGSEEEKGVGKGGVLLRAAVDSLPLLDIVNVLSGISATLTDSFLLCRLFSTTFSEDDDDGTTAPTITTSSLLLHPISTYIPHQSRYPTDAAVRLSYLKGLETIINRHKSILYSLSPPLPIQKGNGWQRWRFETR